jgi:hypothetical protein
MPAQPVPAGQPRLDRVTLTTLAARLTPRDYDILAHLHQHRVLTTHQLQRIFFGIPQSARKRLAALYALNAVTRFRPWAPYGAGSQPVHWLLGRAGAAALATREGITVKELGYNPDHPIAVSSRLAHQVGVNDFFSHLHSYARHTTNAEVKAWWPERRCAQLWGDLTRPDAYGRWVDNGREIDFFLEHDTGTETLTKVTAKLHGYANLAEATGITTPVLFWLPNRTRETNLRKHLMTSAEVPVATAIHTTEDPAGPVWLPLGPDRPRLRLADLATVWPRQALTADQQADT